MTIALFRFYNTQALYYMDTEAMKGECAWQLAAGEEDGLPASVRTWRSSEEQVVVTIKVGAI